MTTRGSASRRWSSLGRRPGRRATRWRWRCAVTVSRRQILTDNGKVFTGRFGPGTGEVLFDRICRENGIKHLLTAPRSPTTTGKVERFHRTLREEFLTGQIFTSIDDAQAQLDGWVELYNHDRPHQGIGMVPPVERFRLASREAGDHRARRRRPRHHRRGRRGRSSTGGEQRADQLRVDPLPGRRVARRRDRRGHLRRRRRAHPPPRRARRHPRPPSQARQGGRRDPARPRTAGRPAPQTVDRRRRQRR